MGKVGKLVKSILPEKAERGLSNSLWMFSCYRDSRALSTPLSREVMLLELSKRKKHLEALKPFEELQESAWLGLGTLGYEIVRHYKPNVIVELGTHMGFSALAMALALRANGEGGRIFAVDAWMGDEQAGHYDESVYQKFLRRREQLNLESTIVPLKMFFDEAKDKVDTPIDLLHIDGLHTWDAVKQDYETFGPLVRPGGLIMFHDVNSCYDGVREFWRELSAMEESHTVPYSHGLGIMRKKSE